MRATSFATRQDLAAFAAAVSRGVPVEHALATGDNGVGAWGDETWDPHAQPGIALHHDDGGQRHKRFALVLSRGHGRAVIVRVIDAAPRGICDLTPAALRACGLDADTDLDAEATLTPA